ncbi:hypothetical protein Tco_0886024 [Tanacetum coccineum]
MLSYTYTPQPFKDLFDGRKAHLLEDKQIPSVRVFDEAHLEKNRQHYGSTPKRGNGVASIKRRRRDLQSEDVKDFVTASERSRLKEDLESSTWRWSHGFKATLWSEDPNQHLKDFLKFVDSLDLDVANRDRTRLGLFQFSLRDQASNWLEHLLAGSISTWEDL